MKDIKDMFKFVDKKRMILVFFLDVIYNLSIYGSSFALSYFVTSPLTSDKLIHLLLTLGILYFISLILRYVYVKISQVFLYKIQLDAEQYFYRKLQDMDPKNIGKYHTGYIQNAISNTAVEYACFFETINDELIPLLVGLISFIYVALKQSLLIGSIMLALFIIAFIIRAYQTKNKGKYMDKFSKSKSSYYATLIDFIQNIFSVIKLDVKDFSNKKIKEKNDIFINDLQELENQSAKVYVTFDFFIDLIYLFIVGISLVTVLKGGDALPYLVFFISIIGKISDKISTCSKELEHVVKFWYLKKQLDEIMSKDNVSKKVNKWNKLIVKDGEFSYKERSKKILLPSFEFEKGDKISIVGESGQGKTTILNVLSGIYPLNSGDILIDDKIVSNPKLDVVYISQDVDLFDLSIRDNLTLGKNISDKKILELFEDAGLMEWYSNLENGLDEMVGEKGVKLSAGQRQRLNIIRGILIDKGVYFFDEPTSNLDKESEEKIVSMIDKYLKDKTYLIVTHRDSIKRLCNKHYYFEDHIMKKKN